MPLTCPQCGERNTDEAKMCGMCGGMLPQSGNRQAQPSRPNGPIMAPQRPVPMTQPGAVPPTPRPMMAPPRRMTQPTYQEPAGFGSRLAAALIDGILLFVVSLFVTFVLSAVGVLSILASLAMAKPSSLGATVSSIALPIVTVMIQWLYKPIMESSSLQATVGKLACGIKVTDLSGNRIGFGKALLRVLALNFVYFAGTVITLVTKSTIVEKIGSIYALLACLAVAWTPDKQGWHDSMAGTLVVRK